MTMKKWQQILLFLVAIGLIVLLVLFPPVNENGEKVTPEGLEDLIKQIPSVIEKIAEDD